MGRNLFGKYELLKKVGTGGMAELFLARQHGIEGFEKLLVLKRILPHLAESRDFLQMFLDEARLAARLNHPNVVQIYDLGKVQNQYFIAMEYINGVDLAKILKRERKNKRYIPTAHGVKIMSYVCEGLTYAHARKDAEGNPLHVVHRDISPQNVLVAFDGGVKLTDFGIAKASTQGVRTKSGTLKGKYYYMSPEQALGKAMDHRSDIFACGIVLYQLMTGRLPFRGDSEFSVLHAIVHDAPRPPSALRPDFPKGLYPILDRSLAKHPVDRFQNALEMQMALDQFMVEEKTVSNTTVIGQYVRTLFHDLVEAQSRASPEDTASMEDMLAGLAIALDSEPGSKPLVETTPSKVKSSSAVVRVSGTVIPVGTPSADGEDDDILILTPSMVAPAPVKRSRLWVPLLLVAVFLSAIGGAILGTSVLSDDEGEKKPVLSPGGSTDRPDAGPIEVDAGAPAPDAGAAVTPPPADPGRRKNLRKKQKKKRKKVVVRTEPTGTGFLTLDTKPWTEVYLQGKRLGLTPLAYHKIPAGRHRLLLRNREKKIRKFIWVEIKPDQTTVKNLNLEK